MPVKTVGGRSVYQNVDNVRRRGLELAWRAKAGRCSPRASYTYLDAYFGNAYPGATRWQFWARLDNLFNRGYAETLVMNDGNGRFFEPAAGRRLMVGVRAQFLGDRVVSANR